MSSFEKKQLSAGEELSALVPVSDRSSFEFEGLVEEYPTLVRGPRLGVSSGGRVALLLRCCLARVLSSYAVFVVFGV